VACRGDGAAARPGDRLRHGRRAGPTQPRDPSAAHTRPPRVHSGRRRFCAGRRIAAAPASCSQVHLDDFALHREILNASHVGAVATRRPKTAVRAVCLPSGLRHDDPPIGQMLCSNHPEPWTEVPPLLLSHPRTDHEARSQPNRARKSRQSQFHTARQRWRGPSWPGLN
jgi:hypothetical protein